jgi:3-oxoacyl-[acyl-carrier protein] reductase
LIGLAGRRVLVTGGSRGIGAACCRLFARAGASVLVQYRSRDESAAALLAELRAISTAAGQDPEPRDTLEKPAARDAPAARIAQDAPAAGGPRDAPEARATAENNADHRLCRCDLRDEDDVEALFNLIAAAWGGLDVLVNNAGVWDHNPLARLDPARLAETLAVNVTGSFLCAAAALPMLERADDGNIVNITSTAGQRGEAFHSPYAASKGAMISATKSWAVELAPRIRVNSVAPGWVDTEMTAAALSGEGRRRALAAIPLARVATPEEIAGPILFLASRLARHITGEVLNVNGGSVLAG